MARKKSREQLVELPYCEVVGVEKVADLPETVQVLVDQAEAERLIQFCLKRQVVRLQIGSVNARVMVKGRAAVTSVIPKGTLLFSHLAEFLLVDAIVVVRTTHESP